MPPIDLPVAGYIEDDTRTQAEIKTAFEGIVSTIRESVWRAVPHGMSISGGALTPDVGFIVADTQAAAAADDLDTLHATNFPNGSWLVLTGSVPASRVVTVKTVSRSSAFSAGQILSTVGGDIVLNRSGEYLLLLSTGSNFIVVERFGGNVKKSTLYTASTTVVVPWGCYHLNAVLIGGGAGGGSGGNSGTATNGTDGTDGGSTSLQHGSDWTATATGGNRGIKGLASGRGGLGGEFSGQSGQNGSSADSFAGQGAPRNHTGIMPIHTAAGSASYGYGGAGGNGSGHGGGGGAGGTGFRVVSRACTPGTTLTLTIGAAGTGGVGGGSNGLDGSPGAILLEF